MGYVSVEGKIQGKGRPRFYNGHALTPQNTVVYENLIKLAYKQQDGKLHEGEVRVNVWANFAIPRSYPKKLHALCESGRIRPIKKPDIDNIAKAVLDGLNGVAYSDDSKVTTICVRKRYVTDVERLVILVNDEFEVDDGNPETS